MLVLCGAIAAVPAYLLSSLNGAIITSKYFYKKDVRQFGSGNPGLTNFYRVFGKGGVLLVIIIDILKTAVPVFFGGWLFGHFLGRSLLGREVAGFFCMLGHAFPVYYRFKGGKTVMTYGTILLFMDWRVALMGWGVFALVLLLTRYVSFGAIIGCLAYPGAILAFQLGGTAELVVACVSAAFLIARHKDNIKRLAHGEESRFRIRKE